MDLTNNRLLAAAALSTLALFAAQPGPPQSSITWCEEVDAPYLFVPGDVTAVDGVTSIAPTGGTAGRWLLVQRFPFTYRDRIIKLRFTGDSRTAGGTSAMDDTTVSWRGPAAEMLDAARSGILYLGLQRNGLYDNRPGIPTAYAPGDVRLPSWRCTAIGGDTIAQIDALATIQEASSQGAPDIDVVLAGENDTAAGTSAAAQFALLKTYCDNRLAVNPAMLIGILDATPHGPPIADYIARNVISNAFNAGIAAYFAGLGPRYRNVHVIPSGSLFTQNALGGSAFLDSSGNHPSPAGYAIIARAAAQFVLSFAGPYGLPWPRRAIQRIYVPRLQLLAAGTSVAGVVDAGAAGVLPVGNQSVSVGLRYRPAYGDLVTGAQRHIVTLGATNGSKFWLAHGKIAAQAYAASLQLYLNNASQYVENDALREECEHWIVCTFDQTAGEASIYCYRLADGHDTPSGGLVSQVGGIASFAIGAGQALLGFAAGNACAQGLKSDLWIAAGAVVGIDDIRSWVAEGAVPPAATAYYPLNETADAATFAPAPSFSGLLPTGSRSGAGASLAITKASGVDRYRQMGAHGSFALNGATPVVIPCPGMVAGDEYAVTLTLKTAAGTQGLQPVAVCSADTLTVTGIALDTSTVAWRWKP